MISIPRVSTDVTDLTSPGVTSVTANGASWHPGGGAERPGVAGRDATPAGAGPHPLGLSTSHITASADESARRRALDVRERMAFIKQAAADRRAKQEAKKPQEFTVEIPTNGGVVQLRGFRANPDLPMPAKRGKVSRFSRASRRRFMTTLNSLDRLALPCMPIFVTLTYPAVFSDDPRQWKLHLEEMRRRLLRKYPDAIGFWKLEPQKRGAPHFHLLILCVPLIDKEWVSAEWYDVVGSGDEKHLAAGTNVERVRSWNGVNHYASKYLGKVPEGVNWPENVGRWWGVIGRKKLKEFIRIHRQGLAHAQFKIMKRAMVKMLAKKGVKVRPSDTIGLSAFVDASVGERLLRPLMLTEEEQKEELERSLVDGLCSLDRYRSSLEKGG